MKKLLFFTVILLAAFVSQNANAQYSTGVKPYPGATHTYQVPKVGSNDYTWVLYKGAVGTPAGAEATLTRDATDHNKATIVWSATVNPTDEYILVLTETTGTCENSVGLPILITASEFDLEVVGGGEVCYTNPVVVAWTGGQTNTDVTYDHGQAKLVYTVNATGLGASETWSFKPNFTYSQTNIADVTITVNQGATAITPTAGIYTLTGNGSVTVEVVADNNNTYNNGSAVTAQNFTGTLTLSNVASGTGAIEKTGTGAKANSDDVDVKRPDRAVISFN